MLKLEEIKNDAQVIGIEANEIVKGFNRNVIKDSQCYYTTRYRGTYLYLDRYDYGTINTVCRLKYNGSIRDWEFAIFKYSSENYDPDEWFFPESEFVDGTILRGCLKSLPTQSNP